ncbi:MAG: N-acetyltransferase [Alphaproteobacteria bacterium]|nr:N-acetyltransferase [Alphaproteobacteria bacterium]
MQIRNACPEDVSEITRVLFQLAEFTNLENKLKFDEKSIHDLIFSENAFLHALLVDSGQAISGMCLFYPICSSWRGETGVYVLDLYVDSELRGTGIGRKLLHAVAKAAQEKWRANYMILDVDKENQSGIGFYENMGFAVNDDDHTMVALSSVFSTFLK